MKEEGEQERGRRAPLSDLLHKHKRWSRKEEGEFKFQIYFI
jgi:hypothetical protein